MTATVGTVGPAVDADGAVAAVGAVENGAVDAGAGTSGPAALQRTRWPDAGLGVLVAGLLGFIAARPLTDNSFLTHLATGRVMLDGKVPTTNPFLYSSSEFPIPSWLWSAVLGVVDAAAGGTGLRILTALCAALLGLIVVRLTRPEVPNGASRSETASGVGVVSGPGSASGDRTLLSVVLPSVCVLITLMPFVNARPQLPGYLLLACAVLVVKEYRSPWWLVAVFGLWVNVHGTWLYGLGVLGLLVIAQAIDDRRITRRHVECVGASVIGVVLGGLAQPHPFQTVLLPLDQFGNSRARDALANYVEWQPAGFGHPLTWLLIAMGIVAVFGALGLGGGTASGSGERVGTRRWGVLIGSFGLVAMGLSAGRLLPLAAITLVPWVAAGVQRLHGMGLPNRTVQKAFVGLGVGLGAVALMWSVATPAYDLSVYPVKAVDWLAARDLAGNPEVKVASHDFVGNYLDWRFEDRANTFVDDRPGVDALIDYSTLFDLGDGWQDALRRANPDVIVWKTSEALTGKLQRPNWVRAGNFGEFTVFCSSEIAARCS